MQLIELTDGAPFRTLLINPNFITFIDQQADANVTWIGLFCGARYYVTETPNEIRAKIEAAQSRSYGEYFWSPV